MYDVAVIGGGPAGSRVAFRLAVMGYNVLVLEQKEKPGGPVCCTGIVSQQCARDYAIDDSVIFRRVNSARLYSPSGLLLNVRRQEPQACILDRAAFNSSMASRAQKQGAQFVLGSPVSGVLVEPDRVRVAVNRDIYEARAFVLATGFGGKLTTSLGLGKVSDFTAGAQVEVATDSVEEVEVYCGRETAPGFFGWLVPTSPGKALVGLLARRNPGIYLKRLISSLAGRGKININGSKEIYGGIPLIPLTRTYGDRLLVVGSAAGQIKPATGGGIYYGLLCADIAADTLGGALQKDDLSGKNLASYQRKWKRRLGGEIRAGYWARKFYESLSDKQIDRMFKLMDDNGIVESLAQAEDISFDTHSRVVLKIIGQGALSRMVNMFKMPFPVGKGK